jgi:uncharacterized protein YndB with AHSA1/START domain
MKRSTFRGRQTVTIQAPRAQVWEYVMDPAKIAEYNPRVARVEPGSGDGRRAAGVSYQCQVVGGGCCTEEDVEIVPIERVVTPVAHDTLGISALLKDYTVETTLTSICAIRRRMPGASLNERQSHLSIKELSFRGAPGGSGRGYANGGSGRR